MAVSLLGLLRRPAALLSVFFSPFSKLPGRTLESFLGVEPVELFEQASDPCSLLIAEGRTVIDVAGQAGDSPESCVRYYAHLFAEFDPGVRLSAEEEIRKARREAGGR